MNNSYDMIAAEWHESRSGFRAKGYVDMILERLKPESTILDLGCGTGRPIAEYLMQCGFRVVGVDRSEKMLEIAHEVVPEAELLLSDMLDAEPGHDFAAAIVWDSLFHLERSHHRTIFRKLHEWIEPGGWLLLSAGGSGDEGFTSEMFGQTFFYSGHEPEVTIELLRGEGFEIDRWEIDDPSSRGHLVIVARRNNQ
jgi:cyclopropane fatty-acyl-phospholipid synthase-like methyltransferase